MATGASMAPLTNSRLTMAAKGLLADRGIVVLPEWSGHEQENSHA